MSDEQVQVREGVWLTRDGEHVEVRARDMTGNESSEWRWEGRLKNYLAAWRNDGTLNVSGGESNGDLVQFLRALPGAEAAPEPEPAPEPAPEPQSVQVREGVWLTRDGAHVEVQANHTANAAEFPWRGMLCGVSEIWHDDGRWRISGGDHYRDLVQYVGPLPEQAAPEPEVEPEPQPTSELQPEQVCEGLWKTRSGQLVEVRARQDRVQTQYRWIGSIFGVAYRWRDDGRKSGDMDHHCDLVAYVGPLPEQTTTDTLAEIEDQAGETLQEALGQALKQAYIADLKKAFDAVTADRDRLQQAHQTMTKHSGELLESAQQARDQRDLLAQQLATKPSEEALQKRVAKQNIEINTLQDKLADMTTDRETLRRQFVAMTADRDRVQAELAIAIESIQNERFQAQTAHAGRKRAEEHLETVTAEVQQLQAELRQARIEIDAEKEAPASNCRAIAEGHLIGAQSGRQAAFEAVERWLEPLAGVDSEHAAAVLQALPGCIRKLAELEGVTW